MSDTVSLSAQFFVAEGTDRKCYHHPGDPNSCIKVLHPERRASRFWREVRYFSSLRRRDVEFKYLAAFRGLVDTSLGQGAVFEMVLDDDGRVSRPLTYYLAQKDKRFESWVANEIEALKQNLYEQWIVFHDLNPTNILVKRLGFDEFRLVVIDGIGHNHFIPLASYSSKLARRKLTRVWNRRYQQWYSTYPLILKRLKPYPVI
ncbi:MAG: hypothetical protein GY935_15865 [Gammaproteobacteria bacterium]|nr:hypothetical protein [Gammaproteobacteria bacterium]